MLPEIVSTYVLPDGTVSRTLNFEQREVSGLYLADKVDANFTIQPINANGELEVDITINGSTTTDFELVNEIGYHYVLKQKPNTSYIGDTLKITLTTYNYLDNGDFDSISVSYEFTITSFVIHSVSINNTIKNIDKKEIYGYINKPQQLIFYFDKTDISYHDINAEGDRFWDSTYNYIANYETIYDEGDPMYKIQSILSKLNSYDNNQTITIEEGGEPKEVRNPNYGVNSYLKLNDAQISDGNYTFNGNVDGINLSKNSLEVTKTDYSPKYLAVIFKVFFESGIWDITTVNTEKTNNYVINVNYKLEFKQATSWYEPTVITTEQEFVEMTSGGRYILANDLVLTNYSPIDVNLLEFDGNGRTIEIQSFASFNEEEIKAGLFKQVYENMIVKNVVVKYNSQEDNGDYTLGKVDTTGEITYKDICNNKNVNYTSAKFGGITAINNGMITNCEVQGQVVLSASNLEQKSISGGGDYKINFFIGGVVAENSSSGYITNSTSGLSIYSQSNIGGFVYENKGKIVSCAVEEQATIYGYNINLGNTIIVELAGFAVQNSGEISMSYVNLRKSSNSTYQGTMSAKDISAGFIYTNSGKVYDAYVQITETGVNNNTFAGFVYQNGGTIQRAYAFVNGGLKTNNNDSMFAPAGTKGLVDCIEIVVSGYANGIESGLATIAPADRYIRSAYESHNFAFGDNESAIWKINASTMPMLVSTLEKVKFSGTGMYNGLMPLYRVEKENDGEIEIAYRPNFAYYGTKQNPYIISDLASWNEYFTDGSTAYYRIINNVDFISVGDNPVTSTMTFSGNIQGNNMVLKNIMLYSTSSLESLGLFKKLESQKINGITNSVRNLTLTATSVWASKTTSVGVLAGVIENYNLYNITIDSSNVVMVGGNAVGGLAGIIHGEFNIAQITSNVGANSTRASTLDNYSVYTSKNNRKDATYNLNKVYYAGSVAGILDGYNNTSYNINEKDASGKIVRDISTKYYIVKNINVNGNITIIADSAGGAFGFVGERVKVEDVNINISGIIAGSQYSAGVAGENRGAIINANVTLSDDIFENSKYVSAGVVGFNVGGLVKDCNIKANIYKTAYGQIVAGAIGRNVNGVINNVSFDGELKGYIVGGFVGANYNRDIILKATSGSGAIEEQCKYNTYLIPSEQVEYSGITNFANLTLTESALSYMISTSNEYYTYKNTTDGSKELSAVTVKSKALG